MTYWIVDLVTNTTLSGGLKKDQVATFIKFNKKAHLLRNLIVRSDAGGEWSAKTWLAIEG